MTTATTYKKALNDIMSCQSSHRWLVQNADQLAQRDCVDAYYDALTFARLAKIRMDEALGKGSK